MAVKKEDAEALANECAQLTTGLPMGDPLLRKVNLTATVRLKGLDIRYMVTRGPAGGA